MDVLAAMVVDDDTCLYVPLADAFEQPSQRLLSEGGLA